MRAPELLFLTATALTGCRSGSVKLKDPGSVDSADTALDSGQYTTEGCDLNAYTDSDIATHPIPAIVHEGGAALRNALTLSVSNDGSKNCEPADVTFLLDGEEVGTGEIPALVPNDYGETGVVNYASIHRAFIPDFIPDAVREYELEMTINSEDDADLSNNTVSTSFTPRGDVWCVVRGHAVEMILADGGDTYDECATYGDEPFGDVPHFSPYCGAVNHAVVSEWIDGNDDGTFNSYRCTNYAEVSKMAADAYDLGTTTETPCLNLIGSTHWATPYMQTLETAIPGLLIDSDGNCDLEQDVVEGTMATLTEALDR
jgi:hypothetical protein